MAFRCSRSPQPLPTVAPTAVPTVAPTVTPVVVPAVTLVVTLAVVPAVTLAVVLVAAAPVTTPAGTAPEDLLRAGNAAFRAGQSDEADRLYAAAEERATDPGLVAFNRAAVLFQKGEFREAELLYARTLSDAECPPDRAAKAWYNRGTALLRRGGSAAVFRSAVACLEQCLESPAADAPLRADARHNLELAKLLWDQARRAEAKPNTPNQDLPPEEAQSDPPASRPSEPAPSSEKPEAKTGTERPAGTAPKSEPTPATTAKADTGPAEQPAPGTATHPPELEDRNTIQPLSPEDTRRLLRDIAARLRNDRRTLLRTLYPPPQPGINDW